MPALENIRTALTSMESASKDQIKGILMDLLINERDLRTNLFWCVDNGIIPEMLESRKKGQGLLIGYNSWRQFSKDTELDEDLIQTCKYITGLSEEKPNSFCWHRSRMNHEIRIKNTALQDYHQKHPPLVRQAGNSQRSHRKFKLGKPALTGISILILLITILIVVNNWRPSSLVKASSNTETEDVHLSENISQSNIEGNFLGEIRKGNVKRKFALMITDQDGDTLHCTLVDYPYFRHPKVVFRLIRQDDNVFASNYGKLKFSGDSLKSFHQSMDTNTETWQFSRRH